jgi:hypothetical protein
MLAIYTLSWRLGLSHETVAHVKGFSVALFFLVAFLIPGRGPGDVLGFLLFVTSEVLLFAVCLVALHLTIWPNLLRMDVPLDCEFWVHAALALLAWVAYNGASVLVWRTVARGARVVVRKRGQLS